VTAPFKLLAFEDPATPRIQTRSPKGSTPSALVTYHFTGRPT